jgi:hypothetical protein
MASYAKSLPAVVDFDQLVSAQDKFDGKLVRVRGFMYVETPPHDVWVIMLCPGKEQAKEDPLNRCLLISLKNDQTGGDKAIKSGWAEITARFVLVPTASGKGIPCLTEIRRIDELNEDSVKH